MHTADADFIARVVIGLMVITSPFDPVELLFFTNVVDEQQQSRTSAAIEPTQGEERREWGPRWATDC